MESNMHVPEKFRESRVDVLHDFIETYPLGVLITHNQKGLEANHLPFLLEADKQPYGVLQGHISRSNPIWRQTSPGQQALVVFKAEDAYISPNWFPSKHESHRQVPTWNYRVVHAHGEVAIHDSKRYVRGLVARLTRIHEASQPKPWKMSDGDKDYIEAMLDAIVGIEIKITRLVGKFKLSQNDEARDIHGAGSALKRQGAKALGQAMLRCIPEVDDQ
jgi:transcriptional regulator